MATIGRGKAFQAARAEVRAMGFSLSAGEGDYRLFRPDYAPKLQEATAYYSDDLTDIVGTAKHWKQCVDYNRNYGDIRTAD